jgi:hypothetical protein
MEPVGSPLEGQVLEDQQENGQPQCQPADIDQ